MRKLVLHILIFLLFSSCATYYQKNLKFNQYFQSGKINEAYQVLNSDKKKHHKDKLVFLLNKGLVASMLGKYSESNTHFEEAYRIADDMHKNYLNEGVALLTNPNMVAYKGEDFEILFIHYYKALNFLKMNEREKALVECRRMDIELNQLNDKYQSARRYKRDAFIHLLMGLVYDVNQDYNNAFISYRNAYEIYRDDYGKMFGLSAPEQLKKDLMRSAYLTGLHEEVVYYEKEFGMKYTAQAKKDGEVIFLWENGLCPIKSEWSINFTVYRGSGGNMFFVNNDLGLTYTFAISDQDYISSGLKSISFIRIAFPKYIERSTVYQSGSLLAEGATIPLEQTEDISQIAFKSLQDRFHLEMGKSLLRFALKKAAEIKVRQENQNLGAALGAFNALTEKADTRNWQSLPHSIYYARVPLSKGKQEVKFTPTGNQSQNYSFQYDIVPGSVFFQTFSTLESARF